MPNKFVIYLLATVVLSNFAGCRISFSGYNFDYRGTKTEKTVTGDVDSDVTSIIIKNQFGDVFVHEGKPGWEWTGACWASDATDSINFLAELDIAVTSQGNQQTWNVALPHRSSKLRGVQSDLTISVPRSVSVKVINKHGDIEVMDIGGKVDLKNRHGDVKAAMVTQLQVNNEHGNVATESTDETVIRIEHGSTTVTGAGKLNIRSEHGKVKVDSASVCDVDLEHGSFRGVNISNSCRINSEHAAVVLTMGNANFSAIKIIGEHSPITINLPASCQPNLNTRLDHARLRSEFSDFNSSEQTILIDSEHGNVKIVPTR